jgi:hypothetical protein
MLQAWLKGLRTDANIPGIPPINNLMDLSNLCTAIIFNGSVVHSAVNFPQARFFAFIPAFPARLKANT